MKARLKKKSAGNASGEGSATEGAAGTQTTKEKSAPIISAPLLKNSSSMLTPESRR